MFALTDYVKSETLRNVIGKCSTPLMGVIAYSLMGLIPFSFLSYVFKWKLKNLTIKSLHQISKKKFHIKLSFK